MHWDGVHTIFFSPRITSPTGQKQNKLKCEHALIDKYLKYRFF